MKIIEGMQIINVNDTFVAISTGEANKVYKGIINLNKTAYKIWTLLEKNTSYEDISKQLSNEYQDLPYEQAYQYVEEFCNKLKEKGILIED